MNTQRQKKNRTISVIIPTYNRAWALPRAIDSVLKQDYPHVEIIVVDDGSSDNTQEILQKYKGKIRVFTQENKGVSAARNLGIRNSTGDFIALLDSDDAWTEQKLSCQIDFFDANPAALICQTQEIWIRNGVRVNPKNRHKKPSGMIFEPSLSLCLVSPSAVMMRKQLFQIKGYFNEALPVCEDYDLWLRISHDTPIHLIDTVGTIKTGGHADQLSSRHSQDKYRIASIVSLLESKVLTKEQEEQTKIVLQQKCAVYSQGCEKRGRLEEALYYKNLLQSLESEK